LLVISAVEASLDGMMRARGSISLFRIGKAGRKARNIGSILVMNKMEVLKGRKGGMQPHVVLHSALGKDLIAVQVKKGLGTWVVVLAQWGLTWQIKVLQKGLDAASIHAGHMRWWFRQQEQKHALAVSYEGQKPPELHAKVIAVSCCVW
jgi:hypothetical protein